MNNKDKGIDLGYTLGPTNYQSGTRTSSNNPSADATSRIDMTSSGLLSDLVSSPNNGLRPECSDSGLGHNKPFLLRNVTPNISGPPNVQTVETSKKHDDQPLVCSLIDSEDEVTSHPGKVINHKTSTPIPIPAPIDRDHIGAKGKGKASPDEDVYEIRSWSDEQGSQESAESYNDVRLSTIGLKRRGNDRVGRKRNKRHDSSFMNSWITNMVKGHSHCNKNRKDISFEDNRTLNTESPATGFRSMFRSLYCPNPKNREPGQHKNQFAIEESKQHVRSFPMNQFYTNVVGLENRKRITEEARGCSALSINISDRRDDPSKTSSFNEPEISSPGKRLSH